jgi:Flp pilus assembly protein TadG
VAADDRVSVVNRWRSCRTWIVRRLGQPERGASAVELAVLAPALMMLCMLILQFGLWFNARQVALASAQAGATVARQQANSNPAWVADAQAAATNFYGSLHSNLLTGIAPRAFGNRATSVYVTVSGHLGYSVFPFFTLHLPVTATAGGPVECFRPAGQNGC